MPEATVAPYSYRADPAVPEFDDGRPLFVFDGVCVLCSGGAAWLMRQDRQARVAFASAQGPLGAALFRHWGVDPDETYLFVAEGRAFTASRGYLELCRVLGGPWRLFGVFRLAPEALRDRLYALVARNRYRWFGQAEQCALLSPEQRKRLL